MATINYISSLHAAKTYYTCYPSASDNRMTRQARTNGTTYVHHLLLPKETQLTLLLILYDSRIIPANQTSGSVVYSYCHSREQRALPQFLPFGRRALAYKAV